MDPVAPEYTLKYKPQKPWERLKALFAQPENSSFHFSKKIILGLGFTGIVLLAALTYILFYIPKKSPPQQVAGMAKVLDNRVAVQGAKAQQNINREFDFPLRDDSGKQVSQIKYVIDSAELRDEILVKGQKATSIKGKTFLILNLKVTNDYSKAVEINTRDYVRFIVGDNTDQQAADIHNDPVVTQAAATKITRIGLTIDDQDTKKIKLMVGEINGDKQTIDLRF